MRTIRPRRIAEASAIVADDSGLFVSMKEARRLAVEHRFLGSGAKADLAVNRRKNGDAQVGAAAWTVKRYPAGEKLKRLRSLTFGTDDRFHRGNAQQR